MLVTILAIATAVLLTLLILFFVLRNKLVNVLSHPIYLQLQNEYENVKKDQTTLQEREKQLNSRILEQQNNLKSATDDLDKVKIEVTKYETQRDQYQKDIENRIKELENRPIQRPDISTIQDSTGDIEKWFDSFNMTQTPRKIFYEMLSHIKSIDDACFYKVGKTNVSIYSPRRVFIYLFPRKSILRLNIFTDGQPLGRVKQFEYEKGGEKWGGLSLRNINDLEKAKPWIIDSWKRIDKAIKNNEPTGYYANVQTVDDE